ncbi:MAG: membrane protein insertase YidC [Acidobacteriota bacterium]|nr:membrane protein insertase YidC [Acidobacteriota bacterium]
MDKRFVLFVVLSIAIMAVWMWLQPRPEPRRPPQPAVSEKTAPTGEPVTPTPETATEADLPGEELAVEAVAAEYAETTTVETAAMTVVLTNRGGRVVSWTLNDYTSRTGERLEMVPPHASEEGRLPLGLDLDDRDLAERINHALFTIEREVVAGGDRVIYRWADGRGLEVTKTIDFRGEDYVVAVEADVIDRGRRLPVRLAWGPGLQTNRLDEGGLRSYYFYNQIAVNVAGNVDREKGLEDPIALAERQVLWAGIEDQYFAALMIPLTDISDFRAWPIEVTTSITGEDAEPTQVPMAAVSLPPEGVKVFAGPKDYRLLTGMGHDLGQAVWFSSIALFAWIARLLHAALVWIHANMVANYGVAIIMTTLALRIVLFPLNQFSMVRMKKMQVEMGRIQPKMNAIKKKYSKKKDAESRVAMNNELMALYKQEGVNPMGGVSGCLPLLAQFPILIGFYDMLLASVELRGAPFVLWIDDLTLKDPAYVTPILMGITMFLQQKMTQAKIGDPMQQRIMMMMPLIFTIMFLNLPSGLVLYWFTNNVLGIGQQWIVNKRLAAVGAAAEKGSGGKTDGTQPKAKQGKKPQSKKRQDKKVHG